MLATDSVIASCKPQKIVSKMAREERKGGHDGGECGEREMWGTI